MKHDRFVLIRQRKAKALLPIDRMRYEELANTHDRIALALHPSLMFQRECGSRGELRFELLLDPEERVDHPGQRVLRIPRNRATELRERTLDAGLDLPDSSNLLSGASFGVGIASGDRAQKELAASSAPAIGFTMANARAARTPRHPRTAGGAQGVHSANHLPL